jgi:guanylate kinase
MYEMRKEVHFVVTVTPQPIRPHEVESIDYYFVNKVEFMDLIAHNKLLEHVVAYGDYKGIPKK